MSLDLTTATFEAIRDGIEALSDAAQKLSDGLLIARDHLDEALAAAEREEEERPAETAAPGEVIDQEPGPGAVVKVAGIRYVRDGSGGAEWTELLRIGPAIWYFWEELLKMGVPRLLLPAVGD